MSVHLVLGTGVMCDVCFCRYDQHPTQEDLINAISISRQWSIHSLYGYAIDHFKRQFRVYKIHPAVVLSVCRRFGIPDLIEDAVKRLAKPDLTLSSWATDPQVTRYISITEIGTIARMKEKLLLARIALCAVPPVSHDDSCPAKVHVACSAVWREFWMSKVVPKLCAVDGELDNELWWIRSGCVAKAEIQGMTDRCTELTVNDVIANPGWRAETKIADGAVEVLMVPERDMLEPTVERMVVDG